jgi:hypothetical protein
VETISNVRPACALAGRSSVELLPINQSFFHDSQVPKESSGGTISAVDPMFQGTESQIDTPKGLVDKKENSGPPDSQEQKETFSVPIDATPVKISPSDQSLLPSIEMKTENSSKLSPKPLHRIVSKAPSILRDTLKSSMSSSSIRNQATENQNLNSSEPTPTKSVPSSAALDSAPQMNKSNSYLDRFKAVQSSIKRPSTNLLQSLSSVGVLSSRSKLAQSISLISQVPSSINTEPSNSNDPKIVTTTDLPQPSSNKEILEYRGTTMEKSDREVAFDKFRARLKAKTLHRLSTKTSTLSQKIHLETTDGGNNAADTPLSTPEPTLPPGSSITNPASKYSATLKSTSTSCFSEEKEILSSMNPPLKISSLPNHATLLNPSPSKDPEINTSHQPSPLFAKSNKAETKGLSAMSSLRKRLEELSQRPQLNGKKI